eukprot:1179944-Prorocentrum_minimum.AAC.3
MYRSTVRTELGSDSVRKAMRKREGKQKGGRCVHSDSSRNTFVDAYRSTKAPSIGYLLEWTQRPLLADMAIAISRTRFLQIFSNEIHPVSLHVAYGPRQSGYVEIR